MIKTFLLKFNIYRWICNINKTIMLIFFFKKWDLENQTTKATILTYMLQIMHISIFFLNRK